MSKMDETIVVARRESMFVGESLAFHGFLAITDPRAGRILEALCAAPFTARRGDVEEDFELLQPIPYVVVSRGRGSNREIFTYTRLTGGGEVRLHGRSSIGVGGHMNRLFTSASLHRTIAEESGRELTEELHFRHPSGDTASPPAPSLLGLINDDTGDVQRVHLGILALVEVPEDWRVEVRETEQLEGSWRPLPALLNEEARARLEEWSVHALHGVPR